MTPKEYKSFNLLIYNINQYVVFVTGLETRAGKWVQVGQVRVRVWVTSEAPAENPHPWDGYGGFLKLNKLNI